MKTRTLDIYDVARWHGVSFRVLGAHINLIHNAARAEGKTVATFLRDITLLRAAKVLKRPAPDLDIYRMRDPESQHARSLGIPEGEYQRRIAKATEAFVGDVKGKVGRIKLKSGEHAIKHIYAAMQKPSGRYRKKA